MSCVIPVIIHSQYILVISLFTEPALLSLSIHFVEQYLMDIFLLCTFFFAFVNKIE